MGKKILFLVLKIQIISTYSLHYKSITLVFCCFLQYKVQQRAAHDILVSDGCLCDSGPQEHIIRVTAIILVCGGTFYCIYTMSESTHFSECIHIVK